jgi:hypothetical protein
MKVSRVVEHEALALAPFAECIERDSLFELARSVAYRAEPLQLPKSLLALEALLGRSSPHFDPWKSSFDFEVLLSAERQALPLRYLVRIGDHRGSIEMVFYRLRPEPVAPPRRRHSAGDDGLSRDDINYVTEYLRGFFLGYADGIVATAEPFHRAVSDGWLVYGKRRGDLFEREASSREEFLAIVQELELEHAVTQRQQQQRRARDVLDLIVEGLFSAP